MRVDELLMTEQELADWQASRSLCKAQSQTMLLEPVRWLHVKVRAIEDAVATRVTSWARPKTAESK